MNQRTAFNQATFVGNLPGDNNNGVCFSLSVHWLANDCEDAFVQSLGDNADFAYGTDSYNRANQIQNAANKLAAGNLVLPDLLAIVQALYDNLSGMTLMGQGSIDADAIRAIRAQLQQVNGKAIIWLQESGGRGHVVAVDVDNGLFFDANSGAYTAAGGDFAGEVARYLENTYGQMLDGFDVYQLDFQ